MEKRFLILIAAAALLTSCSNPAVYVEVLHGNNAFAGGDYQKANTDYISALQKNVYRDYISYNLANVYYALGEAEAASGEWKKASFSGNSELLFRTMYNRGVLEYESGNYQSAFELFRKALEVNPEDKNAKINLEYSLRRINAGNPAVEGSAAGAQEGAGEQISDEIMRVLEFIKRKDAGLWSANEEKSIITGEKDW